MISPNTDWEHGLQMLSDRSGSDFCAAAVYEPGSRQIRWSAAIGNANERFRHLVSRPGQGLAGEVIRVGRFVHKMYTPEELSRSGDSIMVAEGLLTAAAVPVYATSGDIAGVLLMGRRTEKPYIQEERNILEEAAAQGFHIPAI